jgi:hypothetical protein
MFTSVQPNQQNINLKGKKGSLNAGMALAKGERMIKKFTYKELTLIIGIIVALIIVFAFWSNNGLSAQSFDPSFSPKIEINSFGSFTKKVMAEIVAFTIQ